MSEARILAVGGSPRKGGNSDAMLRALAEGARDQGAAVEVVHLRDYAFSSCIGCERCRRDGACTRLMDGMQLLYPLVRECRGLVLAGPAHNYNCSALMKAFIDRLYCFYDFTDDHPRGYSSRLPDDGRVSAVLAVCEQMTREEMGFTAEAMALPLAPLGYEPLGRVEAFGVFHAGKVREQQDTMAACTDLGAAMARRLKGGK